MIEQENPSQPQVNFDWEHILDVSEKFPLTPYSKLDVLATSTIEYVIAKEEGGWILVDNKWDAGGWTFAGITHSVFQNVCPKVTKDALLPSNRGKLPELSSRVVEIYYQIYYLPVYNLVMTENSNLHPSLIIPAMYSCAVNLGPEKAKELYRQSLNKPSKTFAWQLNTAFVPVKEAFITNWMDHYLDLVKENPKKLVELPGLVHRVLKYCFI